MTNKGKGVIAALLLLLFGVSTTASAKPPDDDDDDLPPPPPDTPDDDGPRPAVPEPVPRPAVPPPQPPQPSVPSLNIDDWIEDYPTGESFYQVRSGDMFGGTNSNRSIAYRYLLTEAFLAAKEFGNLDDNKARTWSRSVAQRGNMRLQAIDIIQCAWINDALYGTWGYGLQAKPGPHGRAIRLLPYHPDNRRMVFDGLGLSRNIELRRPADAGKDGPWNKGLGGPADPEMREEFELLWMPAINRKVLWDSDGTNLTTEGMTWPDGTSKGNVPPPWIMDLELGNYADDAIGFSDWGCE